MHTPDRSLTKRIAAVTLNQIVDTPSEVVARPLAPSGVSFPSADLVAAAAGQFNRELVPDALGLFAPAGQVNSQGRLYPAAAKTAEIYGHDALGMHRERLLVEGVRWRVEVGPGIFAVRSTDPARRERALARQEADHDRAVSELVGSWHPPLVEGAFDVPEPAPQRGVRSWSPKSRARMVARLAEFDYSALFDQGDRAAMLTLTYPGDWLTVAPDSATCHRHLLAFRKRFERRYGRPLVAVWKREFQRRGAPHYHLLMMPPKDPEFVTWVSATWADVVAHPDPVQRARHAVAGTGVDYENGARARDPKRLAIYFSKHGSFSAKDYQNQAPAEWDGTSVGRFWGYWHLERAVAAVEVAPDVARTVLRTARRFSDANRYYVSDTRWRKVETVDRETGEIGFRWRKRRTKVPVRRLRQVAGYLVVNDGPAFAASLARYAAITTTPRRIRRSGAGPVGFLP